MTAAFRFRVFACMLIAPLSLVSGNAFRGGGEHAVESARLKAEKVRAAMLDEIMKALGSGNRVTAERLSRLEEAIRPLYLSMQKNSYGNLDHTAVRYVLHRVFVLRHGMYIKGLEPQGGAWNASASDEILEDFVPSYVQSLFEDRLQGQGLDLHEIAILAATLEHIIHDEAGERLRSAYDIMEYKQDEGLPQRDVLQVMDAYMLLLIQGSAAGPKPSKREMQQDIAALSQAYDNWSEAQKFARNILENLMLENRRNPDFLDGKLTFRAVERVVEEIGERFGKWQNADCQDLKNTLVKLDKSGTGRVKLSDFYQEGSHGVWEFMESAEYLRALGVLDDTMSGQSSVLIANYVNAKSNCLVTSSIYAVCCFNECEELLGEVEKEIKAPDATPEQILQVVSKLPSATIEAPRVISESLRQRLDQMAGLYEGKVRIHGRLFSQWMHHAYPRECPYPHKVDNTGAVSPLDWESVVGSDTVANASASSSKVGSSAHTPAPSAAHLNSSMNATAAAEMMSLWTMEEDLPFQLPQRQASNTGNHFRSLLRNLALLAALFGFLMSLPKLVKSGSVAGMDLPMHMHMGGAKAKWI